MLLKASRLYTYNVLALGSIFLTIRLKVNTGGCFQGPSIIVHSVIRVDTMDKKVIAPTSLYFQKQPSRTIELSWNVYKSIKTLVHIMF